MNEPERKFIIIRAFNKAWDIQNKVYSIGNIILPIPLDFKQIGFTVIFALIMLILTYIIPPLRYVPWILRTVAIPIALMRFFLRIKLDGKPPHKFIIAWFKYIFTINNYLERFKTYTKKDEKLKINWNCSRGIFEKGDKNV